MRKEVIAGLFVVVCTPTFAFEGKVVYVQDGDTLTVLMERRQVTVRLDSIDAPEIGQAFGRASRAELAGICGARMASVRELGKDRWGRTIGVVRCGAIDANAHQVRSGMAWVYRKYAPARSPLYELEAAAKAARRGLWKDPDPTPPWDYRRR